MAKQPPIYAIFKDYDKYETFTCDGCLRVLNKARSDETAIKEMRERFPGQDDGSGYMVLCDDCNDKLNEFMAQEGL
jgi:hypothetical protein